MSETTEAHAEKANKPLSEVEEPTKLHSDVESVEVVEPNVEPTETPHAKENSQDAHESPPKAETPSNAQDNQSLAALPPRIVLYDGTCGLCHGVVRFLMDIDTHGAFHYAPLQGETTQQLRARGMEIPENLETVVFVEGDRAWLRSHAIFQAARYLPPPWRMIAVFRWIPRWLTDLAYRGVASIRYQMFGRKDLCEMPALDVRQRFLP